MLQQQEINPELLKMGGIAGIIAIAFLPGVILQIPVTGWFPEQALQEGTMAEWIKTVASNQGLALLGISLSILSILMFMPFSLALYRLLPKDKWQTTAGLGTLMAGIPLALVSFTFAFGFTWAITDLSLAGTTDGLTAAAAVGMHGYLTGDDLATALIGLGSAFFAVSALRSGALPKWICRWGIITGILVTLVLVRYFIPAFAFAQIGYPMLVFWFVFAGIAMLRKRKVLLQGN